MAVTGNNGDGLGQLFFFFNGDTVISTDVHLGAQFQISPQVP